MNPFRSKGGGAMDQTEKRKSSGGENPIDRAEISPAESAVSDSVQGPFGTNPAPDEFATPPDNPVPSGAYDIKPALERVYERLGYEPVEPEAVAKSAFQNREPRCLGGSEHARNEGILAAICAPLLATRLSPTGF